LAELLLIGDRVGRAALERIAGPALLELRVLIIDLRLVAGLRVLAERGIALPESGDGGGCDR
jgi:hypothetical protein